MMQNGQVRLKDIPQKQIMSRIKLHQNMLNYTGDIVSISEKNTENVFIESLINN